jgi:hypothetical protein
MLGLFQGKGAVGSKSFQIPLAGEVGSVAEQANTEERMDSRCCSGAESTNKHLDYSSR